MRKLIKSFAVIAASLLTFNACQREIANDQPVEEELFYITFVAEEPATKTTVEQGTDGEGNKVANYSWTASDANSDRWTVYRGTDVSTSVSASLSQEGKMTITAGFASQSKTGDSFVALFNKGVSAVQNISAESVYDPASDVMVSAPVPFVAGESEYGFRFKRLGAIGKATVKGLTGMTALVDAKLIATDGTIIAADYDVENKTFAATGSTSITVKGIDCDPDENNNFSFYFITVPTASVNLKLLATVWDDQAEERLFVKQLGRAITGFDEGDVFAFNVSGFTEVTTRATFNINGEETSKLVYEGEPVEFPEAPATIAGYDFVGWGTSPISGTQAEAPELIADPSAVVMGNASVTYYAVYAKTTGHGTATHTITYDTENIPSSYDDAADVVLEGVTFNVTQMYKNGEKMQWKASQGTMYNKDAFASIQSVAITYGADNYKNFTVKVGDSANPTSGTSITAAQVGQTATYIYDCSASASDYFVLANGTNAGYLTSIVITYLGGAPTYEDYCTSIDTRTVTSLAWSAPTATVKLNGDDNEYPELTADPEEVLAGVVYSSSETSVADINESGVVTLKAVGETTITAAFPDDDPNYQPSSASYTLVVTAPAKHTVTFSINGNTSSEEVDEGDHIEFPNDPEISGVVFRGWTKNAIVGTQAQAPQMVNTEEEAMGNADVTYYAVFATETEGTIEWVEATLSSLTASDVFVMASGTYAISSTNGTSGNPPAVALTVSSGKITSEVTDAIKWTLTGNASSGYTFYKNGTQNYLYVNTTASSSSNPCIRVGTQSSNIRNNWKPDNNGYLKTNDSYTARYLSLYNNADFRGYINTSNGAFAPTCYKKVNVPGYSNYCTTVVTLSSVVVSGTASKTNYKAGDLFDFTGLVATAVYSDGNKVVVTGDAQWAPTSALEAGATSVNVTATYNDVTSEDFPVSISVATFNGITVKTAPTKLTYTEGEMFNPAGLVITKNYSDGSHEDVEYTGNDDDFSFSPALTTPLATSDVQVTITYQGKNVNQAITVNETPAVDTMDGIFAAATAAGSTETDIKVKFTNCVVTGVKGNNAYLTDNNGKGLIINGADHGFVAGDKLNGTVNCKVKLYYGSSDLIALTATTEGLTVTKDGVVVPQTIAIANLSGVNTGAVLTFEKLAYDGTVFSDGTNTIKPYASIVDLPTLTSGRNYQVNGVYIQFDSTKEIAPRSAEDFVLIEDPYLTATAGKTTGIAAAGETITVTVATNVSTGWSASSNNAAFVIGNQTETTFDVVVAKNEDTDNTKSATITVTATGVAPVNINLTQDKAPKAGETTVSMTSFTELSGNVNGDTNVSYVAAQGTAGTAPAVNSGEIRVYQNGGLFTVTAKTGYKLKSVTIGSSMATSINYKLDDGSEVLANSASIAANKTYTADNLNNTSIQFICKGTDKNSRLYVNNLSVTYAVDGSDPGPGPDPVDASWSVSPASVTVDKDKTATATITTDYDGTLTVSSNAVGIATATISGKVITVTGVSKGSTTLTVTGPATSAFNAVNKTINVTVNDTDSGTGPVYKKVTSFTAGKKYLMVVNTYNMIFDGSDVGTTTGAIDASSLISNNEIQSNTTTDAYAVTIETSQTNGKYLIKLSTGKYLVINASTSSNGNLSSANTGEAISINSVTGGFQLVSTNRTSRGVCYRDGYQFKNYATSNFSNSGYSGTFTLYEYSE